MRGNFEKTILLTLLLVAIGPVLNSRPKCGRGCKTIAEHLIKHGLGKLICVSNGRHLVWL